MRRDGVAASASQRQQERADQRALRVRFRSGPLASLGHQVAVALAEHGQPSFASPQLLWRLVTASVFARRRILGLIDRFGLCQQGPDLLGENPFHLTRRVAHHLACRRAVSHPRRVQHDPSQPHYARHLAQRQRFHEQVPERRRVPLTKSGDRPIVRRHPIRQPPKGHIIDTFAFDHPRRAHPGGIGVQQDSHHQPWIMGRRGAFRVVRGPDGNEIHMLVDQFGDQPGRVLGRQPVIQRWRRRSLTGDQHAEVLPATRLRTTHHRAHRSPIMPCTLPTAEHPARRVADPALPGLPDVPVVIRRLGGACQARAVGRGTGLRRSGRDAGRAGDGPRSAHPLTVGGERGGCVADGARIDHDWMRRLSTGNENAQLAAA